MVPPCPHRFQLLPFPHFFPPPGPRLRPCARRCPGHNRWDDIIPLPPVGGELGFPGPGGGRFFLSPQGGVHSLVKISSFWGKNRPFPSCVLRKFLLSCVHTSRELSDGNFTRPGIIWYDMPRISQCLTTPAAPDRRRGKRRRFYRKGPGGPEGRPDGRVPRENL